MTKRPLADCMGWAPFSDKSRIERRRCPNVTEVILEAFEAYGLDAVKDMKGMFAIALYDKQEKTLHLMRDRAGEKPLYYGMIDRCFVFASDLSCLKAFDVVFRLLKAYGKGFNGFCGEALHHGDNQGAVNAAGQKRTKGNFIFQKKI